MLHRPLRQLLTIHQSSIPAGICVIMPLLWLCSAAVLYFVDPLQCIHRFRPLTQIGRMACSRSDRSLLIIAPYLSSRCRACLDHPPRSSPRSGLAGEILNYDCSKCLPHLLFCLQCSILAGGNTNAEPHHPERLWSPAPTCPKSSTDSRFADPKGVSKRTIRS